MKNRLIAISAIAALTFVPSIAQADHGITHANSVTNSIYSSSATIVCGQSATTSDSGCGNLNPGRTTYATNNWNPTAVAVGPYYTALYRVTHNGAVLTGWYGAEGGRYGSWIDIGGIQRFWGVDGIGVQVILDGPFY